MRPLDWSPVHVVTTTSPRFLHHSIGFQCTGHLRSGLWCWCGSVLTALLPATSLNYAFLLPLLQVVGISGQPRRAYYKFPEPELWSAGAALLSRYRLCGTVLRLLYGDWRPVCSTSDVPVNWMNIHHYLALLCRLSWFWRRIQNCRLI